MSLAECSNSFKVAAASAVEVHLLDLIAEELQLNGLTADSFRLRHNGSYTTVECIVYYLHIYSTFEAKPLTKALKADKTSAYDGFELDINNEA